MSCEPADESRHRGPIRSYVLRRSHFSPAQRDAHDRLMPVFGIPFTREPLDLPGIFGRQGPTFLEVGFGMGETTAEIAAANPASNYIGVEVHTPGVGALLKLLEARGLGNVRVIEHDVREVLDHQIPDGSLTGVHVFFPDPWPKSRHHKRRLIQQQFVNKLATKLCPGGYLHLATDWPDYAEQMATTLAATAGLVLLPGTAPRPPGHQNTAPYPVGEGGGSNVSGTTPVRPVRPVTKFERRGMTLGHPIADIVARKTSPPTLKQCDTEGGGPASAGI